jgi:putative phage-type endonuclease
MTRHGLEFISTKGMSREEWLLKREDGIGGSDCSSILGLNPRFSAVELFYQKIGMTKNSTDENPAMFWGTRGEANVLNVGQYYDVDSGSYIDNFNSCRKVRRITKLGYMVKNPEFPWLIGNLDGAVNFTPRNFKMDGPAEAKTISRQTAEQWENGLPPYHLIQIHVYAIICAPMMRTNEAHIFYLEDGHEFRGFRIPVSEIIKEKILIKSEDFWKRVVKGREIMATIKDDDTRLKFLSQIEPDPDNSEAYYEFLSELFKLKQSFVRVDGKQEDIVNALAYKKLGAQINEIDEKRQEYKNKIMKSLHNSGANILDFGDAGKVTFNKKLYVNIKEGMLEETV